MSYLLIAYIAIFSLGSSALFIVEFKFVPPEERDPPLETILDLSLAVLLLTGMLLLAMEVDSVPIKHLWKGISVSLTAYALYSNLRGRKEVLQTPESAEDHGAIVFADTGTLVLLFPAIAFNIYYAFWA